METACPPVCPTEEHDTERHGTTMKDPYFWLRHRGEERVLNHLKAENEYTQGNHQRKVDLQPSEMTKHTVDLQTKIYEEMLSRIKQTDEEVPHQYGPYFY
jgi:oligopeptidase B